MATRSFVAGALLLAAIVCFLLVVGHAHFGDVDLTNLGLAFGFGGILVSKAVWV